MNAVEAAQRKAAKDLNGLGQRWAIVGGFAVSARAEPRFTRDVDIAVAVSNDDAAEFLVRELLAHHYRILASREQDAVRRLATVRLGTTTATELGRLAAEADDGEITADELFYFALLLLAGNETTTNLLSTMFVTLAENPDQFELIRADPDALLGSAIEEQLRYSSPIQAFYRTALADYPVGDATIPAGARVALLWGAANRDPREYDDPDTFRADRNPTLHMAFGSGVHLCLGAGLARMEGRAVLRELVERVDRIEVIRHAHVDHQQLPARAGAVAGGAHRAVTHPAAWAWAVHLPSNEHVSRENAAT